MAIKISGSTIIDDSRNIVNAGISTFGNDVTLTGASYNATWDASASSLIFNDNAKAKFGTDSDLEIYYSTHSYIKNKTGSTADIRIGAEIVRIGNVASTENYIVATENRTVDLYHDNSPKFYTASYGACVVGSLCATTLYGDGSCLTGTGFNPDACQNLYAGTGAGSASGASTLFNVAIGFNAGKCLLGGDNNVFLGCYAGHYATDCVDNVFLGSYAGRCNDGSYNIFLGINSGKGSSTVSNNTAGHNIAIGESAGCGLESGCSNVFLGLYAGKGVTSGSHNVFLGHRASSGGTVTGGCNLSIGFNAGKCVTEGMDNIFLGRYAGCGTTGCDCNIFVGMDAGRCNDGSYNIFLGINAGKGSSTIPDNTGGENIAIGLCAGMQL